MERVTDLLSRQAPVQIVAGVEGRVDLVDVHELRLLRVHEKEVAMLMSVGGRKEGEGGVC